MIWQTISLIGTTRPEKRSLIRAIIDGSIESGKITILYLPILVGMIGRDARQISSPQAKAIHCLEHYHQ